MGEKVTEKLPLSPFQQKEAAKGNREAISEHLFNQKYKRQK